MTLEQIELLVARAEFSSLGTVEIAEGGCHLRLVSKNATERASHVREGAGLPPAAASDVIRAPFAGIFHAAHPLGAGPAAANGVRTRKGQIVGFLKVGPVLRPVTAEDGIVEACLVTDGILAGYGMPLFRFRRSSSSCGEL